MHARLSSVGSMNRLNGAFTVTSVLVLLVTIERFSFTTTILLQPYNFIRLHELVQGPILLTLFLVVSAFVLKEITCGFKTLRYPSLALFVVGAYLYGLGEGWHEVTSFTLNQHCDFQIISGDLCRGLFINDYYTGNILFFICGDRHGSPFFNPGRLEPPQPLGKPQKHPRRGKNLY